MPKITIITATYNSEKDIERCILSVANQVYQNKEHLIIDGLSSDRTLDIVKKYTKLYSHIRFISEKDRGVYDAMNKGIDLAEGEWLYFLGSDDIFLDNEVLKNIFKQHNVLDADVIYGNVQWGDSERIYDGEFDLLKLLDKNICHQAILVKKNIFEIIGKFDIRYRTRADWESNLRWLVNDEIRKIYLPIIICKYNISGLSSRGADPYYVKNKLKIIESIVPKDFFRAYKKNLNLRKELNGSNQDVDKFIQIKRLKFCKIRNFYIKIKQFIFGI